MFQTSATLTTARADNKQRISRSTARSRRCQKHVAADFGMPHEGPVAHRQATRENTKFSHEAPL